MANSIVTVRSTQTNQVSFQKEFPTKRDALFFIKNELSVPGQSVVFGNRKDNGKSFYCKYYTLSSASLMACKVSAERLTNALL
jgi:hypothetical protein